MPDSDPMAEDVTRRTWLAAERTWLAWWRSGIAVGALALGVGRVLPAVTHHEHWAFRLLGIGYGLLSVGMLLVGGTRQSRAASALRRGELEHLAAPVVFWFTAAAVVLSVAAMILVAAAF